MPGERFRDNGIGLCRMPDDDEPLASASRVVHGIEQVAPLLQPARLPDLQAPPSVRYLTVRMGWELGMGYRGFLHRLGLP